MSVQGLRVIQIPREVCTASGYEQMVLFASTTGIQQL